MECHTRCELSGIETGAGSGLAADQLEDFLEWFNGDCAVHPCSNIRIGVRPGLCVLQAVEFSNNQAATETSFARILTVDSGVGSSNQQSILRGESLQSFQMRGPDGLTLLEAVVDVSTEDCVPHFQCFLVTVLKFSSWRILRWWVQSRPLPLRYISPAEAFAR